MIVEANGLKEPYERYQRRCLIKKMIEAIPKERRHNLAEEIRAKANLFGCKNEKILQAVLKHLETEE